MADAIPVKTVTSKLALPTKGVTGGVALPLVTTTANLAVPIIASTGALALPVRGAAPPPVVYTWSPVNKFSDVVLSNSNLTATCGGNQFTIESGIATVALAGPVAWQVQIEDVGPFTVTGIMPINLGFNSPPGHGNSCGYQNDGSVRIQSTTVATLLPFTTGDLITIAATATAIWFKLNAGSWNNNPSADPSTNTGGVDLSALTGEMFPGYALDHESSAISSVTLVPGGFVPPSGFPTYNGA